jgi:hypothetical protein
MRCWRDGLRILSPAPDKLHQELWARLHDKTVKWAGGSKGQ